jgi:hypothetical protein
VQTMRNACASMIMQKSEQVTRLSELECRTSVNKRLRHPHVAILLWGWRAAINLRKKHRQAIKYA